MMDFTSLPTACRRRVEQFFMLQRSSLALNSSGQIEANDIIVVTFSCGIKHDQAEYFIELHLCQTVKHVTSNCQNKSAGLTESFIIHFQLMALLIKLRLPREVCHAKDQTMLVKLDCPATGTWRPISSAPQF